MVRLISSFLVIRGYLVISAIWVISTILGMCVIRLIQYGTFIRALRVVVTITVVIIFR